ncbi:DUF1254 domain-containing protein [Aquiflexum lacus]|uniref:DUF1254 domain-containing protein n=1 Tax=Aquiflexum lacus TaxID=2483805 RepID=UPI001E49A387|nr:DUF1214 domain-containing protein [Aquiflexum lacus]
MATTKMESKSEAVKANTKNGQHTPADFNVSDFAYKVSETDFNIKRSLEKAQINEWAHQEDVSFVETQQVIRENQDVIYSSAVVDVSQGATISLPPGDTFQVIQIIDMQNYTVKTLYPGESITLTPDHLTYSNYVYLNMRTRKKSQDEAGLKDAHRRQLAAVIDAKSAIPYASPEIVIPLEKMEEIRTVLIDDIKRGLLKNTSNMMGTPTNTDPQGHLYATVYGWGGLPIEDAGYLDLVNNTKLENGKSIPSQITFKPADLNYEKGGFWSITTYNMEGWLAEDQASISNSTAVQNEDGTYTIHFNNANEVNNISTPSQFSALLRNYVPTNKSSIIEYLKTNNGKLIIE